MPILARRLYTNGGTGGRPPFFGAIFGGYYPYEPALQRPQVRRRVAPEAGGTLPRMQRRYTPPTPPLAPSPAQTIYYSRPTAPPKIATRYSQQIFYTPPVRPDYQRQFFFNHGRRDMPFSVPFLPGGSGGGGLGGLIGAAAGGIARELASRRRFLPGQTDPFGTLAQELGRRAQVQTGLTFQAGCGCLTNSGRKGRMVYDARLGGVVCKQVRRLNPANGRAAIRAVRRISATHKLLRRIEKAMAKTCRRGGVSRGRGSFSFGRRKKKSCS
jgi:hypothetical protein